MELPPLDLNNNDFIPIEDLPSEKFEIPSELLGKFEATKMEAPVMPAKESKQKNQQRQARQNNRNNRPNNNNNNNQGKDNNPQPAANQNALEQPSSPSTETPANNAPAPAPKPVEKSTILMIFFKVPAYWKSCPTDMASSALQITTIFLHPMTFMCHSRRLSCSA